MIRSSRHRAKGIRAAAEHRGICDFSKAFDAGDPSSDLSRRRTRMRLLSGLPIAACAVLLLLSPSFAQQHNKGNGKAGPKPQSKSNPTIPSAHDGSCTSQMLHEIFFVDFTGSVSDTGRTYEGPVCITVLYNPVQQFVALQTSTATTNGPDLSKVVLGGPSAGGTLGAQGPGKKPANLPAAVAQLYDDAQSLGSKLNVMKQNYATSTQHQEQAVAAIALLRQTTKLLSGTDAIAKVKTGYEGLRDTLNTALASVATYVPSDRVNNNREILLAIAQNQEDQLNALPLEYPNGTQGTFSCTSATIDVAWSDWVVKCKDSFYTPLKTMIDANFQIAKDFASDSANTVALKRKVAIVQYWNTLFSTLGLQTNLLKSDIEALDISHAFYTEIGVRCGALFNQSSNTSINIATADLGPTLDGNDPTIKAQGPFVTISCGTPFAVSAGVGFNTIEQRQFAIVQGSDGKGGTINTFGITNDSKVTPTALVIVHVRLAEWDRHRYGFYGSFGVGGSLQNPNNSSPVQFLPGVSISFLRTMYVTLGPDIGSKTSLIGGFKVGDPVPSGISSVTGLTETSHAVGFGLAVTFTKP